MGYQSLDQERAKLAWACVPEKPSDEYRSIVREFPSMVQSMGIGQAVAFLMAKGDKGAHKSLLGHVTDWLWKENAVPWKTNRNAYREDRTKLLKRLLEEESKVWWVAERETIEFAVWLKRFAEARTAGKQKQPGGNTPHGENTP